MSTAPSDHPETSVTNTAPAEPTSIQSPTNLTAPTDVTPLPPPPVAPQPVVDKEQFLRQVGRFDAVLVALVLLFAFVVASFPASNPDFFRQLATGRMLLEGNYHFGTDPFLHSSEGVYWVNHSWLFAILSYLLYQIPAIGGTVVVIAKALLIVALAELMLRASRPRGQSLWIPAACTLLALLAVSPRLFLQPTCFSFVFLALTWWLLMRPSLLPADVSTEDKERTLRAWWLLPIVFAVWVNCDAWFFLGPLAVALFLAGELIQLRLPASLRPANGSTPGVVGRLGLILLIGCLACLLNPHHVYAFTLPPEMGLSPGGDWLERDGQFSSLFISPIGPYLTDVRQGMSVAGWAGPVLSLLGLASFGFLYRRPPWQRLLVWVGFAILGLYSVRAIPFFAIVAGPIMARNWLDVASEYLGTSPRFTPALRNWSLGGRILTMLLAVALLFLSVPGWLQAQPREPRRLGWHVHVDPALEQAAQTIHEWRQQNRIPVEPNWFNLDYEVANYLAWFAPGERAFLDQNLPDFRETAEDYVAIRDSLEQSDAETESPMQEKPSTFRSSLKKDWRKILRNHRVHYWIFDNKSSRNANLAAQLLLFSEPEEWVLCAVSGRIAIFAWRDPGTPDAPDPSQGVKLDLQRLAFGNKAEQAPPVGSEPVASGQEDWETWWREAWNTWWQPEQPEVVDRDLASLLENRHEALLRYYLTRNARTWQGGVATSAFGLMLPGGPVPNALLAISWSCAYKDLLPSGKIPSTPSKQARDMTAMAVLRMYVLTHDDGLPESIYLALRAARRSLGINNQDAMTHMFLARAYTALADEAAERPTRERAPEFAEIRRTQIAAALNNCLRLHPPPRIELEAHLRLYGVLEPLGYEDVRTTHLREALQLSRRIGPPPGVSAEQFTQVLTSQAEELNRRDSEVKKRQELYDLASSDKNSLQKIHTALEKGLAETAWNEFRLMDPEEIKSQVGQNIRWQMIELCLKLGWLHEASELLNPVPEENTHEPVSPALMHLHLRLAAARGDYAEADRHLAESLSYAWKTPDGKSMNWANQQDIGRMIGQVLLVEASHLAGSPRLPWVMNDPRLLASRMGQSPSEFWVRRWRMEALTSGVTVQLKRSELHLLRGWLALEQGRCSEARQYFQSALNELAPEDQWYPEIRKLNAMFELPDRPSMEQRSLESAIIQQRFQYRFARHYLHWLDVNQR